MQDSATIVVNTHSHTLQQEKPVSIIIIIGVSKSRCGHTLVWSQSDSGFKDLGGGELVA